MSSSVLSPIQRLQLATLRNSGLLDEDWYAAQYPDVNLLGMEPTVHYLWIGAALGRDPGPGFSTQFYLHANPDVADAGLNPLFHYLSSGRDEGRLPLPTSNDWRSAATSTDRPVGYRLDRCAEIHPDEDWLLFVAYCSDGRLSDCQKHQLTTFRRSGYRVALIVNSDNFSNLVNPGSDDCDAQIVRDNVGFDFGAWKHAIEILGALTGARSVTFTNDSVLPVRDVGDLRKRAEEVNARVLFMTDNLEVRPHAQSYFFRMSREALAEGALSILTDLPYYLDKDSLIHEVEIELFDRFRDGGYSPRTLFPMVGISNNPTIHHWEKLLDLGLPFLKVQLITAGILAVDDPRLKQRLGPDVHACLREHCERRTSGQRLIPLESNVPPVPAMRDTGRFNEYGAQQAFNLSPAHNPTLGVPLADIATAPPSIPRVLAVVHCFYVDVAETIFDQLSRVGIPLRLVCTTDTKEKVQGLEQALARFALTGEVVLSPNRGRDVAPFLVEGKRLLGDAEVILHLHTKKSPHDQTYASWAPFLYDNLIGSREIVLSILKILQETQVGLIYSDHFPPVVGLRNWGYDFDHARALLDRIGIGLSADDPLEFPTSTMFWARREALEPLFGAGLRYEDFEEEEGQIDGTLAHAIERSFLYVVQSAGFSYAKVTSLEEPSELGSPFLRLSAGDLSYALDRPTPFLAGDSTVRSDFHRTVPEIYPVSAARSRSKRRRLSILLPTMQPAKIYGGITTALRVVHELLHQLPADADVRVLITSDKVDADSVAELTRRLGRSFALAKPDDDPEGNTIVGLAEHQHVSVSLRARELYVATAWWTADLGYRLLNRQEDIHRCVSRLAYIIQDFEPGFYNWSNTYALAEATYRRPDVTAAIINSEELANFLLARYDFEQACCIRYETHPRLAELIEPTEPERLILAYGRPSTSRNCFELLCEGLRQWQSRNPSKNSAYEIIFAGEDFETELISSLINARNVGKVSLEEYAALLNRAAIGISLMVSPHPSYPPLEMATAGCVTVTNSYESKDLSKRADNIISVDALTPHCLADSIDIGLSRVVYGEKKELRVIRPLGSIVDQADFGGIARWLLGPGDEEANGQTDLARHRLSRLFG